MAHMGLRNAVNYWAETIENSLATNLSTIQQRDLLQAY